MVNRLHTAHCGALISLLVLWSSPPAYGQSELRQAATTLCDGLHKDPDVRRLKGQRLVVAEFENITAKGDVVPRTLQEMLSTAFIKAKAFRVIERAQLDRALRELKLSLTDLVDPDNRKKLGKFVDAQYMLVGSISEGAKAVSIDARLVSIETGESVSAESASISLGAGVQAFPNSGAVAETEPKTAAPVDINERGIPSHAGEWLSSRPGSGLLGNSDIRVSWREQIGGANVIAFAAGDVIGDGTSRLALRIDDELLLYRWTGNSFKRTASAPCLLRGPMRISTWAGKSRIMIGSAQGTRAFTWTGTALLGVDWGSGWPISQEPLAVFGPRGFNSGVLNVYSDINETSLASHHVAFTKFGVYTAAVVGDFDGDHNDELAVISPDAPRDDVRPSREFLSSTGKVAIFSTTGERKGITQESYSGPLATWTLGPRRNPFIVACKQQMDAGDWNSTLYLLCFTGESYENAWRSMPFSGMVLDIQRCDPKGEGKPGLIIMTAEKHGTFLTRLDAR